MLGTARNSTGGGLQVQGATTSAIAAQTAGGSFNAKAQGAANVGGGLNFAPHVLLAIIAIWVGWSVLIQHDKIWERLKPANVMPNANNWFTVGFMALSFIVVGKIFFTKLTAWGVPGAATVAQVFAAG